ncbi:MAG: spore coat U domain-containing protein [Geminicoccaceae bacterium]|nr:spore coat U domain-containing protein [Geminicoccaceae bacterium]MDW8125467.1 spore coat U domain-containing protein [Geminicoccaceae bacterium]
MRKTITLLFLGCLALAGGARAATATGSLAVTVEVVATCRVGASSLDFGVYGAGQTADLRAQGTIAYENCTASSLRISLDGGSSGNPNGRTLTNAAGNRLAYQLYRDSARTRVWGSGANALSFTPTSASGTVPVYGTIPGGQSVPLGRYSDTVVVTIEF